MEASEILDVFDANWLAKYQCAMCNNENPLTTFQGVLVAEIVVPFPAYLSADPAQLLSANSKFVQHAMNWAAMILGEFPVESLYSHYTERYRSEVLAKGHRPLLSDKTWDPIALKCVAFGMNQMGAREHFSLFQRFIEEFVRPSGASKLAPKPDRRFGDLDLAFRETESRSSLTKLNADWLRVQSALRPEFGFAKWLSMTDSNPLRAARLDFQQFGPGDPAYAVIEKLCTNAAIELIGVHGNVEMISGDNPLYRSKTVATSEGLGVAVFRQHREVLGKSYDVALFLDREPSLARTYMKLSRAEFEKAFPES